MNVGLQLRSKRARAALSLIIVLLLAFTGYAIWRSTRSSARVAASLGYNEGYVDSAQCDTCHADIAKTFHQTGMGRSFYKLTPKTSVERWGGTFDHPASGMHYEMYQRGDQYFERRSTTGFDGKPANVVEEQIDYVIGSGTHGRAFMHRAKDGRLIQLPVSWFAEKSGYWAMTPGYDSPHQPDTHGSIGAECMFCHNGYPTLDVNAAREADGGAVFPAKLPEGVDCQRCHGPGREHVALAKSGKASQQQIQQSIVNPGNLPRERQLEVCFQCHLETSNRHSPAAVRLYDRDIFSYRPGQPLGDYKIYVERPKKTKADEFEIAQAGYQLPKSACFRNSKMTCLTCHDPHDIPHGKEAILGYVAQCQSCHQAVKHTVALPVTETCISCHMPKRRDEGSVHLVLTDHYIQRYRPVGDLLKPLTETSFVDRSAVDIFYPKPAPQTDKAKLALAIAQVSDSDQGIDHLRTLLNQLAPDAPEPYMALARAYVRHGQQGDAIPWFEHALQHQPDNREALRELGAALQASGQSDRAIEVLRKAADRYPKDGFILTDLGNTYLRRNMLIEADEVLHRALDDNPEDGDAYNLLGLVALAKNDNAQAEKSFREAERWRPDLSEPYDNLGTLLMGSHQYEEAAFQFKQALFKDAKDGEAHHGLGLMYLMQKQPARAETEMQQAVQLKPNAAQIHADLADLLSARNAFSDAATQYQLALTHNPNLADAHLGLAQAYMQMKQPGPAVQQLQMAAASSDPAVSQQAQAILQQIMR